MPPDERQPTVLLIDDNLETRDLLCRGLRRSGFGVFTAGGEWDGGEIARAVHPDVILLEFGRRSHEESFSVGRRVKWAAGLAAGVPLAIYAAGEDETARAGAAVEVAPGEYVVLPEDHHELAALMSGLIASTWRPRRGGHAPA